MKSSNLPQPTDEQLAKSTALGNYIANKIRHDGAISFADYMSIALYHPRLGYYSGDNYIFGEQGDFITAPELSPLFAQACWRQIEQICALSAPVVLECGAGSGIFAADLLHWCQQQSYPLQQYLILELSAPLRQRQREAIARVAPEMLVLVSWIDDFPENFSGCVVANEVLDVLPVHRVLWRDGEVFERYIDCIGGQLVEIDKPAQGTVLQQATQLSSQLPRQEYISEIGLAAQIWISGWAQAIHQGGILLIDYGYPQTEYYLANRAHGTVQCYYRHHAHNDLLCWPGLNDITSFVDFTAIAEAAVRSGLELAAYTNQAQFLFNCGILALLEQRGDPACATYIRAARAVQRMTTPQEMGELFKCMLLTRNIQLVPVGFASGDKTHQL